MDTSSILLLVVSASISFALGRFVVFLRDKKRNADKEKARLKAAEELKNRPPEPEAMNKAKRKRQLRDAGRQGD
ncbi:MAG: hypothetical protein V4454_21470 [Pseudomonadota bacterium]